MEGPEEMIANGLRSFRQKQRGWARYTMEVRYEIVHERQFDEQMVQVMGSVEHGDEFIRLIELDLAGGVERGCLLAENVWRLETRDGGPEPVRIDYMRDEVTRRIHLLSITR